MNTVNNLANTPKVSPAVFQRSFEKPVLVPLRSLLLLPLLLIGCLMLMTLTACGQTEYQTIGASAAQRMIEENPGAVILDVRNQDEFDQGHVPAAILLPVTELSAQAADVLPDKNALILIYCRSGNRSATAAQMLVDMGYRRVYDFGGIIDPPWPYELQQD